MNQQRRKSFLFHWVLPTVVLGVIAGLAIRDRGERKTEAAPQQAITKTAVVMDASVERAVVDAAPTAVELEAIALQAKIKAAESAASAVPAAKGFDVKKVLGRNRSQVAKILGKENKLIDITLYDKFENIAVMVQFENGKAAVVSVEFGDFTNTVENRSTVLAWMGATEDDEWRVDMDKRVEVWDPEALARRDERKRVGRAIGDFVKRISDGGVGAHAWGELETILIVRGDGCTSSLLREFGVAAKVELGADLKKLGFVSLKCEPVGATVRVR